MTGEWISVDDRMPEPSTDVLCVVRFGSSVRLTVAGSFPVSANKPEPHEWLEYAEPMRGLSVTHWMPLPEAP